MRKRDELTDPNSCMSKAKDDEWTFVLLGRDAAAPVAVRAWIDERIRLGKNTADDAQVREAEQWIRSVRMPSDDDIVTVRRGTLAAACYALETQREAPETLAALRRASLSPAPL